VPHLPGSPPNFSFAGQWLHVDVKIVDRGPHIRQII